MNKYLERRNINLQNEANTNKNHNDQTNYISPHKKLVSDKTEMKKSISRPRDEFNGDDESLEEIINR
jgi:alkyl sulfatase BDS1-like metallo-beta-lactamase superfamily hydrolase